MMFSPSPRQMAAFRSATAPKGWKLELNMVRWEDGEPKLDLHVWSPDHEKCSTRGTFTREEAKALLRLLKKEV